MKHRELCDTLCPRVTVVQKNKSSTDLPSSVPGTLQDFRKELCFSFTAKQYY